MSHYFPELCKIRFWKGMVTFFAFPRKRIFGLLVLLFFFWPTCFWSLSLDVFQIMSNVCCHHIWLAKRVQLCHSITLYPGARYKICQPQFHGLRKKNFCFGLLPGKSSSFYNLLSSEFLKAIFSSAFLVLPNEFYGVYFFKFLPQPINPIFVILISFWIVNMPPTAALWFLAIMYSCRGNVKIKLLKKGGGGFSCFACQHLPWFSNS